MADDHTDLPRIGTPTPGVTTLDPDADAALSLLLAHVDEVVVACAADGTIAYASPSVRVVLGYDPAATVGRNLLDFVHPDEVEDLAEGITRWVGRPGTPQGQVQRVRDADGRWQRMRYDVVTGPALGPLGDLVVTLRFEADVDVSRSRFAQRLLNEDRLVRLASTFLHVSVDDFDQGLDLAMGELAGLEWITRASAWRVIGQRLVVQAQWQARANAPRQALPEHIYLNWPLTRRLAALQEVHIHSVAHLPEEWDVERAVFEAWGVTAALVVPMATDGRFTGAVMVEVTMGEFAFDATHLSTVRSAAAILSSAFARHDVELELAERATRDSLTGLPNRWAFHRELQGALDAVAAGSSPGLAVSLVDIDRFKTVNDSRGHDTGDRLLADVAERLRGAMSDGTGLARLGGDEFLLVHHRVPDEATSLARTTDVLRALRTPFDVEGSPVVLTASAGVVHCADGAVTPAELLRRAEVAMYRAKERGGDTVEPDDEHTSERIRHRLTREGLLRAAIEGDGLVVHYQAEWDLVDGRLLGAEALARWDHPDDGLLAAGAFIPLAEECGLIAPLGARVLTMACAAAADWRQRDPAFGVRVNLSAHQLREPDLVAQVSDALADAGLPADALCLELTESSLLVDPERSLAVVGELRDLGVGLAVDDFGTGYSSMLYLKRLPLTSLKLDRAFVEGLPDDTADRAIVKAVVGLAGSLGVTLTAEGVEEVAQRDALVELGCHRAQGFLLARPEAADAFAGRL